MKKASSIVFGVGLVMLGMLALVGNLLLPAIGFTVRWWEVWRWWPLIVIGIGLLLLTIPFAAGRGAGAVFIAAIPLLTTGGILLFNSLFNAWDAWAYLWPYVILAVATGFILAGVYSRIVWFGIPAILIGANGLVLAFCNWTGLWEAWSVLWTIEPLSVGLILLLIAIKTRAIPLYIIGAAFCSFAIFAFSGMAAVMVAGKWLFQITLPASFILLGGLLIILSLRKRPVIGSC